MTKRAESKYKINRRLGVNLWGRPKSPINKREYGPGQHGQRRKKPSDFGVQLMAKQKLKGYYGTARTGWSCIPIMKRYWILVRLRGAVAALQPSRRCTANRPQEGQQCSPNRQTPASSEPAHQNYPRPRFSDKEVATRIPDTISLNQRLGDSTFEGGV